LSPTRELAQQINRHFGIISQGKKFKVVVLSKANANVNTIGDAVATRKDVLISTPMRLVSYLLCTLVCFGMIWIGLVLFSLVWFSLAWFFSVLFGS
jgi:superfamily II DNA/RNA helicase